MPAIILTAVTALEVIGRSKDRVAVIIEVEVG